MGWLGDIAACTGDESYSSLLQAAREGEVELPSFLTIRLLDGQVIHLGPHLTTPTSARLKKTPNLSLATYEGGCMVSHTEVKKEEKRRAAWEEVEELGKIPGWVQEEEEEQEEQQQEEQQDGGQEESCTSWQEEEREEKEKADLEEEEVEDPEEKDRLKAEGGDDPEEQRLKEKDKRRKLFISFDDKTVTKEELESHFAAFGEVKDVYILPPFDNFAEITFTSDATAVFVSSFTGQPGQEEGERRHSLHRPGVPGGIVPIRLRGGSGRGHRVPPLQQRHAVSSFRYSCMMAFGSTSCSIPDPFILNPATRRNPHFLSPANLYRLSGMTPRLFQRYCRASRGATPARSPLPHEARVMAWSHRYLQHLHSILFEPRCTGSDPHYLS